MASSLDSHAVAAGADFTLTEGYKTFIESMLSGLRQEANTRTIVIDPSQGYLYRSDLTSFLLDNQVPLEDHYLVMRINGLNGRHEIDENLQSILVPDHSYVARLKQIYRTSLK